MVSHILLLQRGGEWNASTMCLILEDFGGVFQCFIKKDEK